MTVTLEAPAPADEVVTPVERARARKRKPPSWFVPVMVFLLVRTGATLLLARVVHLRAQGVMGKVTAWDGRWFIAIAERGYGWSPPGLWDAHYHRDVFTAYAFFPGYPTLIHVMSKLPMVTPAGAAVGVSVVASLVAAAGVARLGEFCGGGVRSVRSASSSSGRSAPGAGVLAPTDSRRVGLLLVVLFAAAPMGVVLWMAYSEALFCALAVWALVGVLERRWLVAGVCAFACGLVRPTGLVVAAVLIVAVLAQGRRDGLRAWFAAVVAPLGTVGYIVWVGARTHNVTGWFDIQRKGWGTQTDFGKATLAYLDAVLVQGQEIVDAATALILIASAALLVALLVQRWPWEVKLYAALVFATVVTSAGLMHCRPRLLLPAFVLALPIARRLAEAPVRTQWLAGASVVLLSAWFGTYMVGIYPHSI